MDMRVIDLDEIFYVCSEEWDFEIRGCGVM